MSSPILTRLKATEAKMSPRQLVLAQLEEAKAAGSVAAYARKIAENLPTGTSPLMERVEKSVRAQSRRMPREQLDRRLRRAQMEAMYLNRLVWVCNESVLTHADLWEARGGMLTFAGLHLADQEDTTDEQMLTWCRGAERHWLAVESEHRAIEEIGRESLGADLLLPAERERLQHARTMADSLLGPARVGIEFVNDEGRLSRRLDGDDSAGSQQVCGSAASMLEPMTAQRAWCLRSYAKMHVFQQFDDRGRSVQIAVSLLGATLTRDCGLNEKLSKPQRTNEFRRSRENAIG